MLTLRVFHKRLETAWLAEHLLAFQIGLCCEELLKFSFVLLCLPMIKEDRIRVDRLTIVPHELYLFCGDERLALWNLIISDLSYVRFSQLHTAEQFSDSNVFCEDLYLILFA